MTGMDKDNQKPMVHVEHLKKYFPVRKKGILKAVDDVSFDICAGVHDVAQREILLDAQEIGLHQIVELQEDEYRLVFVVREQFAPLAQLFA